MGASTEPEQIPRFCVYEQAVSTQMEKPKLLRIKGLWFCLYESLAKIDVDAAAICAGKGKTPKDAYLSLLANSDYKIVSAYVRKHSAKGAVSTA